MLVYADNAATTKLSNAAAEAMRPILFDTICGNPSSTHQIGQRSKALLEAARETIAECIGAEPDEIYFTSGGTEADNWAMQLGFPYHRLTSCIEHHAVLECMEDGDDTFLPVSRDGLAGVPEHWDTYALSGIGFVSVMLANNEIGTIQPVREIAKQCRGRNILFHTDAVQAVGHIPVDVKALGVDMLSASAHKFHGPNGVGFLYVRKGIYMSPFIYGGGQENGMRSGTENVPGIVGMAAALKHEIGIMPEVKAYISAMRDRLIDGLLEISGSHLNGARDYLLPGIVNIGFDGIIGESLVLLLSQKGICVSSGSACTSGNLAPSHVLTAMGQTEEQAKSAIRISLSRFNTPAEIDYILETVPQCVSFLRGVT